MKAALVSALLLACRVDATDPPHPTGGSDSSSFYVDLASATQGGHVDHATPTSSTPSAAVIILGANACTAADHLAHVTFCPGTPPRPGTPTLGDIQTAFARLPLPPGRLVIQPPGGRTLVNFATNFYTPGTRPLTRRITLLGRQVTIEARPAAYRWDFGDGHGRTTRTPGAPYPHLTVTHAYAHPGSYAPTLATTYAGRFRLAGGPWRPIPTRVTVAGAAERLRAIEATPHLVGPGP